MHPILEGLTEAQREAVLHVEGPLLILAGPGSGKTRVVTHRIAWLLEQGVPGGEILALTFTNKAADEMRRRVERLVPRHGVWLGTFHRFCAGLLRRYGRLVGLEANYTIYDEDDAAEALRAAVDRLDAAFPKKQLGAVMQVIRRAKTQVVLPEQFRPRSADPFEMLAAEAYPAYQRQLLRSNAADFDDLLLHVVRLLAENPEVRAALDERYRFILVDEYQDTNLAQYAIARSLSIDHPNLAVTGDPDQSIYGWRGANLRNIMEFERDYPRVRVVRLEQNYRSTQRILHVAADLIARNVRRKEKHLFTENGAGVPVRLATYPTHRDEAADVAARIADQIASGRRRARDFAVFYRVNALSRTFETALRARGVAYQLVNAVEFYQRREVKDVLGYLQLLSNPSDDIALLRVVNVPPRGIGKTTLGRLADHATRQGVSMLDAARQCRQVERIGARAAAPLLAFVELFDRLAAVAHRPVEEILGHVLSLSGYGERLENSTDDQDQQRLANIQELLTVAREFDEQHPGDGQLEAFLEETSLVGDTDQWEDASDRVTLMTLHASKGLEFPVVFLTAVEQGLLPHARSLREAESRCRTDPIEEERRLMFVGITRAQEELHISHAKHRDFRGRRDPAAASEFLMDLPRAEMEIDDAAAAAVPPKRWAGYESGESYDAGAQTDDSQEDWSQEVVAGEKPSDGPPRAPIPLRLTTAAELAQGEAAARPACSPDAFAQGMVVLHPEYGLGRIVAIGGAGPRRTATVHFAGPAGEKRFVLASSPLRPVRQ